MSEYVYWLNGVVPAQHVAIGNALGAIAGAEPGDAQAFTRGVKLRTIGGPNVVSAYGVAVAIKAGPRAMIDEFNSPGPWPNLNARGVPDALIAQAKAVVHVQAGDRSALESQALAYWASLGWEPVRSPITFPA